MFTDDMVAQITDGINFDFSDKDAKLMDSLQHCANEDEEKQMLAGPMVTDDEMLNDAVFGHDFANPRELNAE